jgi:hypothetical protein
MPAVVRRLHRIIPVELVLYNVFPDSVVFVFAFPSAAGDVAFCFAEYSGFKTADPQPFAPRVNQWAVRIRWRRAVLHQHVLFTVLLVWY